MEKVDISNIITKAMKTKHKNISCKMIVVEEDLIPFYVFKMLVEILQLFLEEGITQTFRDILF